MIITKENIKQEIDSVPNAYLTILYKFIKTLEECELPVVKEKKATARGMLKEFANPDLIEREKDAWELAVKEKHHVL